MLPCWETVLNGSLMVLLVLQRGTVYPCSFVCVKHSWKTKGVCLSSKGQVCLQPGIKRWCLPWSKGRHSDCSLLKMWVSSAHCSFSVMPPSVYAVVIWPSSHHPLGTGVQRTGTQVVILCCYAVSNKFSIISDPAVCWSISTFMGVWQEDSVKSQTSQNSGKQ